MSRPLRIEYPGAWYHVMNRGRRSEKIFVEEEDYQTFIELMIESSELWSVDIYSYALMPNHYHLLINTPLGNLNRFMRHLNGVYTQRFNSSHRQEGSLFKGRYKSLLIEFDSYFIQLVKYIHRNPIRARITDNLNKYKWTSHPAYMKNSPEWNWIKKEMLLSMLSEDKNEQVKEYSNLMRVEDKNELLKKLEGKKWPSILGGENFISSIKKKFFPEKKDVEIPDSNNLSPDLDLIKEMVCEYYQIDRNSLCREKRQLYNEPRNVSIYLSRFLRNDSLRKISKDYLLGSDSSVSAVLDSVRKLIKKDPEFENKTAELKRLITKREIKT